MFLKYKKYENVHTGYKKERWYESEEFHKKIGPKNAYCFPLEYLKQNYFVEYSAKVRQIGFYKRSPQNFNQLYI